MAHMDISRSRGLPYRSLEQVASVDLSSRERVGSQAPRQQLQDHTLTGS